MKRQGKGMCPWTEKPTKCPSKCPSSCPVPSVDNSGNPYPGCALVRLKSQAEIDAEMKGSKGPSSS